MKKKIIITIAALTLSLAMGVVAFAAGTPSKKDKAAKSNPSCAFVDANGDGICDNGDTHCSYVDADGDGICDVCKNKNSHSGFGHGNHAGHNGTAGHANHGNHAGHNGTAGNHNSSHHGNGASL